MSIKTDIKDISIPLAKVTFKQDKLTPELEGFIEAIATGVETAVITHLAKTQAMGTSTAPGTPITLPLVTIETPL